MLTFQYQYHAQLKAFVESLDIKSPESGVTFVVVRKAGTLILIAGCASHLHMITLPIEEECSLKTGKFTINASLFKMFCQPLFENRTRAESIHLNVEYQNRRLPMLTMMVNQTTWRDAQAIPANDTHLELLTTVQSAGFELVSKCWLESALNHTLAHPALSLFRLNHRKEQLEIISKQTLHTFDVPYQNNPSIDLQLDSASVAGLKTLCRHSRAHGIYVCVDSEVAYFSDEITTICFALRFDEADIKAKPIHYRVESTFSVHAGELMGELTAHSKVDTLHQQNQTSLYVSPEGILIGSATDKEACHRLFENKVPSNDAPLLYSLRATEFKQALSQYRKLSTREVFLQVLLGPDGSRVLGLYKDTGAEHPYSTVAIELSPQGLASIEETIEYHQSMKPAQGDLFSDFND
ncbi:hypothetical protein VIN01S_31460 [Vibrio inusitatus NBRC 102082]|uniref:DNA polymerase III subunit beta n=1 Tax=Vibrio inusitatus NBRC 102082 TaxID=1219070 RepID=A0A4Y3I0F0_9VIBR|nr:hypothetical protein [Vibrio inusitatus]GEA52342.1 hypothetical protein VIN01S_31460 [Vibrio inusitatus NBRC 102082]